MPDLGSGQAPNFACENGARENYKIRGKLILPEPSSICKDSRHADTEKSSSACVKSRLGHDESRHWILGPRQKPNNGCRHEPLERAIKCDAENFHGIYSMQIV